MLCFALFYFKNILFHYKHIFAIGFESPMFCIMTVPNAIKKSAFLFIMRLVALNNPALSLNTSISSDMVQLL